MHIFGQERYFTFPLFKPGTDNQPAGTYQEVGPRGGQVSGGRVVHIDQGDRLPPTQEPGRNWVKQ
ncbi:MULTISPECIES: YjzC family protein [Streptococcus]|uniref:YjzC family protein n=1 Tax=Streptococcus TaxID=1301 RepID=UPI000A6F3F74|nr:MULTISPECIES: YjzC family protein [Streptococcus]